MIRIEAPDLAEVRDLMLKAGKHLPFALSKALNDLAFVVRSEEMDTVRKVFDRPRPQTVRNFFVRKGNKSRPSATIWFDQMFERGFDEYMVPQVEGGGRGQKKSERMLGRFYVPGAGAKLDRYGNMQGGQVTQVLSQLRRFGETGWSMNQTSRSVSKRRGAAKSTEYFMVSQPRGGLVPGVYQRVQSGAGFGGKTSRTLPVGSFQKGRSSGRFSSVIRGRGVVPIMIFTRQPRYNKRFPFFDVANKVADQHYRRLLGDAVDYALRTSR